MKNERNNETQEITYKLAINRPETSEKLQMKPNIAKNEEIMTLDLLRSAVNYKNLRKN